MAIPHSAPFAPDVAAQLKQLAHLVSGQLPLQSLAGRPPAEVATLCRLAGQQGMAPLLYRQCQEAGLLPLLPRPVHERLLAAYAQAAGYNLLAMEAAQEWTAHLEAAGITAIWLKGVPLSLSVYPAPDTRPMVDIDVLVPPAQRDAALRLATRITGTRPVMLHPEQAIHAVFKVGQGAQVKMELHWSLIAPPASDLSPNLDWFLDRVMLLNTEYGPLCTLAPEAHLLYLCAHAQLGHGESQFKLVRYLDMARLLAAYAPLDWEAVVAQAVHLRWTFAVERALRLVAEFFGPLFPAEIPARLAVARPADEDSSLVLQRGQPGTRWDRLRTRMQGEEKAGRVRLALALLFPPPAYIRWRYQVAGWKVPLYYPYRWFDGLREFTRSK